VKRAARRAGARLLAAGAAALAIGCALPLAVWRQPHLAACPGQIASPRTLPPGAFLLRERARIRGGGVDAGFEVVAERRDDQLVVVGFNSFGAKAFGVTQRDLSVEARSFLGRALQVAPENFLRDLYAAQRLSADAPERAEVARPGCGYTATYVRVERRPLD
jgi:hypothetical protein